MDTHLKMCQVISKLSILGSPGGLVGKQSLPAMQETQVRSLGGEDPLEKEMETHSSILAWKMSWTGEAGRLQPMGSQNQT